MSIRYKQLRIESLRARLSSSDYKAIKYAEGLITAEEYAPIKAQRELWREEINRLESEIESIRNQEK